MSIYIVIPFLLGSLAVFQPLLNRFIMGQRGMAFAAWLNSLVLFIMASLLLGLMYFAGDRFPEYFRIKADGPMRWWFILPGMMGFAIVFNLPLSMRAIGAFPTIIALLLGQLVASFIFDTVSQNQPISWARLLGLGFAAVGAYLSFRPAA